MNRLEVKSELHTSEIDDNLYLVIAICIDGEPMADFRSYATSLTELRESILSNGTYFILTCWCGVPECAGIYEGVEVTHDQKTVKWVVPQPEPKRVYVFEKNDYEYALNYDIEKIKQDIAHLWFTVSGIKEEKLQIVPGMDEDIKFLEPKVRKKPKNYHHSS